MMWNHSNRYYHNSSHLDDLLMKIESDKSNYSETEYEKLIIIALFHDVIYVPGNDKDNVRESLNFFDSCCIYNNADISEIRSAIMDTKNHKPKSKISQIFSKYDMSIVESDFDELLKWEDGIYQEYKKFENYKKYRLKFIKSLFDKYPNNYDNLYMLYDWVKNNR
jgi:pantetheine-phosphate adenylyltransferase